MYLLVSQHVSGIIMPIIRRMVQGQYTHVTHHVTLVYFTVLYTTGIVSFIPFSWWWAWWCPKHGETPINTSSSASSWLFIHLHLLIKPYKLQLSQTLKQEDMVIQHKVCWQILTRTKNDNLPTRLIVNNETTFHSKMNQHNSCVWGTLSSCHHSTAQKILSKSICDPYHCKGEGLWHFCFV
jgi:hypothetical protein